MCDTVDIKSHTSTVSALVWKNLVSHILVKIEFDQFLDLLGFALSLHAVTVQIYQQLSKILVWKNLVSHIIFFLDDPGL